MSILRRKAGLKAKRTSLKNKIQNYKWRDRIKIFKKSFDAFLTEKNLDGLKKTISTLTKILDKSAKKNIIHKNKANRLKSRYQLKINKLEKAA